MSDEVVRWVLEGLSESKLVPLDRMNDICDDHGAQRRKRVDDAIAGLADVLRGDLARLVSARTESMRRNDWNDFLEAIGLPPRRSYGEIAGELLTAFERRGRPEERAFGGPTVADEIVRHVLRAVGQFGGLGDLNAICDDHGAPRRRAIEAAIDGLCEVLRGDLDLLVSPRTGSMSRDDWNDLLERVGCPPRRSYAEIGSELRERFAGSK